MSPSQKPIRVGIIGVGWGSVVQTPAFRMVPPFEVAALCSRRKERVEAAGAQLGIDDVSSDWESFVRRDDLDVISVCTPVDLHHAQTLGAIAAGKHVLVEKPLGLNATETAEMLAAATKAGVAHAVCFESRWEPTKLALWELVKSGHLGTPYLAATRGIADYWHPTRGLQSEWMYRLGEGGGYLMGMGSHDIDYLCTLFGEPVQVCADVRTSVTSRVRPDGSTLAVDADDTAVLLMRMANGMLVTISISAIALGQSLRSFDAYGSNGAASYEASIMVEHDPSVRVTTAGTHMWPAQTTVGQTAATELAPSTRMPRSGMELPKRRAAAAIRGLALMLEDWLPAFDGEPSVAANLADGHRVQRVVDAARRSAAGEGWVAL